MHQAISFQKTQANALAFDLVEDAFRTKIAPLYKGQCSTLAKMAQCNDRHCELMFVSGKPAGFIIYKIALQNEFALEEAFELKTLLVFDAEKNGRKGLGSLLFNRATLLAQQQKAQCIYSTVVNSNLAIIYCAIKNGLTIAAHGQAVTDLQRKAYPLESNELLLVKYLST